jgi:hypothetical protein
MENRLTEEDLKYPKLKADLKTCHKFLSELCKIVWDRNYHPDHAIWSIPPREEDFDMQFSAAFDELQALRQENSELKKALENVALGEYSRYLAEAKEELEAQNAK